MTPEQVLQRLRSNVLVVRDDGTIRAAYGGGGKLAGWPLESIIGANVLELLTPHSQEAMAGTLRSSESGGVPIAHRPSSFPVMGRHPDGTEEVLDVAPAGFDDGDERGWVLTVTSRADVTPRADVIDRLVRGEPLTETAPALAARLTYDTVDSHHLSVVIIWPGTQEAGLYAGAADLAIEPVLRELIRTDHRLWSHDPALDVVNVDQDLIPETLRAAMLADGVVEVLSMRADVSGRTGVVVLQFVRDTNLGGLSGNTRLAYHELRLALTRTLEREEGERLLREAALVDSLTGLANRAGFEAASAHANLGSVVLFVDLDYFKAINDQHGHAAGDAVLVEVASRLRSALRPTDHVARLGGDEFAAIISDVTDQAANDIAGRLLAAVCEPLPDHLVARAVSASIGMTRLGAGDTVSSALVSADLAMLDAKRLGRARLSTR